MYFLGSRDPFSAAGPKSTKVVTPRQLSPPCQWKMPSSPQRVFPARVGRRVVEYLNTALLSPQMLYLTSQPNALTVSFVVLEKKKKERRK